MWTHNSFKDNCWYSFVQGENAEDATDSGYIFTRKLRDMLNIPNNRIVKFDALFRKLEDCTSTPQNIILVDDFVGSGAQTDDAWNVHRFGNWKMTLGEHQSRFQHRIIYAPLIVNNMGLSRINVNCPNLHLEYIHHLGPEYNMFNVNSIYWNGDEAVFERFINMMVRIAKELNIPITYGNHVSDFQGFGQQSLALAFNHGIPDACPAVFYWDTATWKPLKKTSISQINTIWCTILKGEERLTSILSTIRKRERAKSVITLNVSYIEDSSNLHLILLNEYQ